MSLYLKSILGGIGEPEQVGKKSKKWSRCEYSKDLKIVLSNYVFYTIYITILTQYIRPYHYNLYLYTIVKLQLRASTNFSFNWIVKETYFIMHLKSTHLPEGWLKQPFKAGWIKLFMLPANFLNFWQTGTTSTNNAIIIN